MLARAAAQPTFAPRAAGIAVGAVGCGFVGAGLWARRDVMRALEQERIVGASPNDLVSTAGAARSLAESIRRNTVEATEGRTYSEIDPYVDEHGIPTSDAGRAARDDRTGGRLENPEHALWVQSTTLQTALMQAYVAFRLAELTVAIGAGFVAAGTGLAALGYRSPRR